MARAIDRALTTKGNTEDAAKVDLTLSNLSNARGLALALTGELLVDVQAIEAKFDECDDYLPQFASVNDLGRQFSDAWFALWHVDDLRRRASKPINHQRPRIPNPHSSRPPLARAWLKGARFCGESVRVEIRGPLSREIFFSFPGEIRRRQLQKLI
ncbi:MAG: hypothetical protein ABI787_09895 [Spartobacteria bacterium]